MLPWTPYPQKSPLPTSPGPSPPPTPRAAGAPVAWQGRALRVKEGADIRRPPPLPGAPPAPGSRGDSPPPTAPRTEPGCVHVSPAGDHTAAGKRAGGRGSGTAAPHRQATGSVCAQVCHQGAARRPGQPTQHCTHPGPAPGGQGGPLQPDLPLVREDGRPQLCLLHGQGDGLRSACGVWLLRSAITRGSASWGRGRSHARGSEPRPARSTAPLVTPHLGRGGCLESWPPSWGG